MLRLALLGADSQIASTLCARCPHTAAGCCVAPPPLGLADLGRIVARGGQEFLLAELGAGRLVPAESGLRIRRTKGRTSDERGAPRLVKCAFHGPSGCTIAEDRRSVTCNVYICESALHEEKSERAVAREAERAHAAIVEAHVAVGRELATEVRARYPEGPPYDTVFFAWLGEAYSALVTAAARSATA